MAGVESVVGANLQTPSISPKPIEGSPEEEAQESQVEKTAEQQKDAAAKKAQTAATPKGEVNLLA
jgi:hypothetical protein